MLDARIRNVKAELVQADELVNFVYSRGQNTKAEDETTRGDFFTYLAVDAISKLVNGLWRNLNNGSGISIVDVNGGWRASGRAGTSG